LSLQLHREGRKNITYQINFRENNVNYEIMCNTFTTSVLYKSMHLLSFMTFQNHNKLENISMQTHAGKGRR